MDAQPLRHRRHSCSWLAGSRLAAAVLLLHLSGTTDAWSAYPTYPLISEVQTSGDGASPATDEFIEIYNPYLDVNLDAYSIQYLGPSGTFEVIPLTGLGTLAFGGFALVAGAGYDGPVAPAATYSFDLSEVGGTVFLAQGTAPLTSCNSSRIRDKVAYGTGDDLCPEGGAAFAPSPGGSIERKPGASDPDCGNLIDVGYNALDLAPRAVAEPQSQLSPTERCADVQVTLTDSPDPVATQAVLTYTVTVSNLGPLLVPGPSATASLSPQVTFLSTDGCSNDPGGYPTCHLGFVEPGLSRSYTIAVRVNACIGQGTVLGASVEVPPQEANDPELPNNAASSTTTVSDPGTCSDGNACTADTCANGACVSAPIDCADSNPCTIDTCIPASGCKHTTYSCNDSNQCTTDACTGTGSCTHTGGPFAPCSDGNVCTANDLCNAAGTACVPGTPANCDDGDPCTIDSCNASSGCRHDPRCDDDNDCTLDHCDPSTLACSHPPAPVTQSCYYPEMCNEHCDGQGNCVDGVCGNGGNPCMVGLCHFGGNCVLVRGNGTCDDGDPYTFNDVCDMFDHCSGTPCWMLCGSGDCNTSVCNTAEQRCDITPKPPCSGCNFSPGYCDAAGVCQPSLPEGCVCSPPGEVEHLEVNKYGSLQRVEWSSVGPDALYDLLTGYVHQLPVGSPGSWPACAWRLDATYLYMDMTTLPGQSFWFLVRARTSCPGTFGYASDGVERISSACAP